MPDPVGTYNPAGYVASNPATWPQPPAGTTLYQPGMSWTSTGTGVVDGVTAHPGDLLFAAARPRLFGDFQFGQGRIGSNPDQDWTYADVRFLVWDSTAPPWAQTPYPYSGCKFGDTGWWIVIDSYFADLEGSRTFGESTFGASVFGSSTGTSSRWVDITRGYAAVQIDAGNDDGADKVDATEIRVDFYDPDYTLFDLAPPATWHKPADGDPLRVGFWSPDWRYHRRAVTEIESTTDVRSGDPRFVTVLGVAPVVDLTRTMFGWQRPAELASTRIAALIQAGGWRYTTVNLVYPTPDVWLTADRVPRDVTARDEIDRTCQSAGWFFDTDRYGGPRVRPWPIQPVGTPVAVVDCADHGVGGIVATSIAYVRDESQMLNIATVSNADAVPVVVTSTDPVSIAVRGNRDRSLGFPKTGLAFQNAAAGQLLADRAVGRYANVLTHVDELAADTAVDAAWLDVLTELDTGAALTVTRVHPTVWTIDGIVVGYHEAITPGRIETTIRTTTLTQTF